MDDPVGLAYRNGNQLEQAASSIRANHEHTVFTVVLVFDDSDRVLVSVDNVRVIDPMLAGRLNYLHA